MAVTAEKLELSTGHDGSSGHGAGEDRPVDLVHLARYTMGNRSLEREVLRLFCCQAELYVDRLRDAPDSHAWEEAAHTLKGSARGIGAWDVAEMAERAEGLAADFRSQKTDASVDAVSEKVAEANRFIRDILADG